MARSRNIKPGFFTNADLSCCSPLARILFVGLWTIADRSGRLRDRPKQIKGEILPYDDCDVEKLLDELAKADEPFIVRYEVEGVSYIQVTNFGTHQSPHHTERDSVIPPLPNGYLTVRAPRALNQESGINEEGIINPESAPPKASKQTGFHPPTVDEVRSYCLERGNGLDPQKFVDFYQAKGWKVGKTKMVDWKASVRTWEGNNRGSPARMDPRGTASAVEEYLADAR